MLRQLRVVEGIDVWDGFESAPVTPLPPKFRMPDMERYTGRGCPRTHLRISSQLMRGMGLDEAQSVLKENCRINSWARSSQVRLREESKVANQLCATLLNDKGNNMIN